MELRLTCIVMKGAKKDKKNGKDSGGVVAAVTKHTAGKFAYVKCPSPC